MDNYIKKIKNKNIHIVGAFGAEGSAVLEFLAKKGIKNITAHDFSTDKDELRRNFSKTHLWVKKKTERLTEFENLLKLPAKLNLKNEYLEGVLKADIIFAPSSWHLYKPNFPILQKAKEKEIEFSSLTKLYFELAKGKIISVTGTKGKGATSRLIYDILAGADKKHAVYLAGNDRRAGQELDKISQMNKNDILVLETSNRQLMNGLGKSPDIGVITNISPDHINEHGGFENYIEAKKSLFKYSQKGDIAVLNYDNEITKKIGEELSQRKIDVSPLALKLKNEKFINNNAYQRVSNIQEDNGKGGGVYFFSRKEALEKGISLEKDKIYVNIKSKEYICDISEIRLIGEHNLENVLAAALAAYLAGAPPEKIREAIKNFRGLPHRIEFIGEYGGVKFYDDLASTNPESTIAAIKALANQESRIKNQESRIILIMGGDDKEMEYAGLARVISENVNMLILLPGTGSEKVKSEKLKVKSKNSKFKIIDADNFLETLEIIKTQTKTGDIALISPACAHFQARYIDSTSQSIRRLIVENFTKH